MISEGTNIPSMHIHPLSLLFWRAVEKLKSLKCFLPLFVNLCSNAEQYGRLKNITLMHDMIWLCSILIILSKIAVFDFGHCCRNWFIWTRLNIYFWCWSYFAQIWTYLWCWSIVSRPTRWSLWYWYLDVYVDHLYFQIQVTEKYSTAMWYLNHSNDPATTWSSF